MAQAATNGVANHLSESPTSPTKRYHIPLTVGRKVSEPHHKIQYCIYIYIIACLNKQLYINADDEINGVYGQ